MGLSTEAGLGDTAGRRRASAQTTTDDIIDELVPDDLDWRHLVESYPVASISLAGLAGFLLGRNHGSALIAGVSTFIAREMSSNILSALDGGAAAESTDGDF